MKELFKNRLTIGLVIFYTAGIFIGNFTAFKSVLPFCVIIAVLTVAYSIFTKVGANRAVSLGIAVCVIILSIGVAYMNYSNENRQKELRSYMGKSSWIYGTVTTAPKLTQKGNHYSITVDVHKIEYKNTTKELDGKIIVYVSRKDNTAPKLNDCVYFFTTLESPDFEEGNFDYNEYLRTKDIYATGFTDFIYPYTGSDQPVSLVKRVNHLGRNINIFIQNRIDSLFSYDKDAKAMIKGILLGEKGDFSDNLQNNLSIAGFSHITAVSGLHLSILFGALCGFLGFMKIHRGIASFIALPVVLIFAAVTGFSPSVCRAAIMLVISIFAFLTGRQYDSLTALFLSAFIILTVNPYSIFSISFILSFCSTLSIILFYGRINNLLRKVSQKFKIVRWLWSSFSISASALIGTAPFIAYYFGIVSFSSFFANIWVVPLCAPIFILGYAVCGVSLILPEIIYNLILYPLAFGLEIFIQTANLFGTMGLYKEFDPFSPVWILAYYVIIFIIFSIVNKQKESQE